MTAKKILIPVFSVVLVLLSGCSSMHNYSITSYDGFSPEVYHAQKRMQGAPAQYSVYRASSTEPAK